MSFHLAYADGRGIEKHERRRDAEKAFWILTAHELKNGRSASLQLTEDKANGSRGPVVSATGITPPGELDLASWVCDVLTEHGLL